MVRSTYGARRVAVVLFFLLLSVLLLLPTQLQRVLQQVGGPVGWVLTLPIEAFASLDRGLSEVWEGYIALQGVREDNQQLRKDIEILQGQNNQLRETAAATQRLAALLSFKERATSETIPAQVIGRDATNWYHSLLLNKGTQDGVQAEMGVMTPAGVVGRIVKATTASSVVLLVTDPNNAIAGLIQRTRDEGIVEGTMNGRARLNYIPLLSGVRAGDRVVTSGLTGGFPRGVVVGAITRIEKEEGDLFQSAEIVTEVDFTKLEEVLIVKVPYDEIDRQDNNPPADTAAKDKP